MVNLKRCNYFTGELSDVGFAIKHIVDFLENDGRNSLLITPPKSYVKEKKQKSNTSLKYLLNNQFTFETIEEFTEILENKSNLFRVDLLIFDFTHLHKWEIVEYRKIIEELNIDFIIAAKEYHYVLDENTNDFHIRREYKNLKKSELFITDNINKWTTNLNELELSYKRDLKIKNIFGDSEDI